MVQLMELLLWLRLRVLMILEHYLDMLPFAHVQFYLCVHDYLLGVLPKILLL